MRNEKFETKKAEKLFAEIDDLLLDYRALINRNTRNGLITKSAKDEAEKIIAELKALGEDMSGEEKELENFKVTETEFSR